MSTPVIILSCIIVLRLVLSLSLLASDEKIVRTGKEHGMSGITSTLTWVALLWWAGFWR